MREFEFVVMAGVALVFAEHANAGMPYQDTVTCPINGNEIEITSTMSCSTMGRTMSMQPVTSCDFVTRLPTCREGDVPIYKDFSGAEIIAITKMLDTPDYKLAQQRSAYYLAAYIENNLPDPDVQTVHWMLQSGFWYTPDASYTSSAYRQAFHEAAKVLREDGAVEGREFWLGAEAYIHISLGNMEKAADVLALMRSIETENEEFRDEYYDALTYCLSAPMDDDLCQANTNLRAHKK